jgi:hypothetical protein
MDLNDEPQTHFVGDTPKLVSVDATASVRTVPGNTRTGIHENYDPYIKCLLSYIPVEKYRSLIHSGIVSASTHHEMLKPQPVNLQECVHERLLDLIDQGICTQDDWNDINTAITEPNMHALHDSFVVQGLPAGCDDNTALLYDYLNTQMFKKWFNACRQHTGRLVTLDLMTDNGMTTESKPILGPTDNVPVLVEENNPRGRLNLMGNDAYLWVDDKAFDQDDTSYPYLAVRNAELINSPTYLVQLFEVSSKLFNNRSTYTASLIKQALHKGFFEATSTGIRMTPYGQGVAYALMQILDDKTKEDIDIGANPSTEELESETWELSVGKYIDALEPFVKNAKQYTGTIYKAKLKHRGKRRKYKLMLDAKSKSAWFQAGSIKKPVWSHIKSVEPFPVVSHNSSARNYLHYYALHSVEHKLVPVPKYVTTSGFKNLLCYGCGGSVDHKIVRDRGDIQLWLECTTCGCRKQMPYVLIHNTAKMTELPNKEKTNNG